jgi:hypothetical protein
VSSIDRSLHLRQVIGRLRKEAGVATSKLRRDALRGVARKIDARYRLRLSTAWWVATAERMLSCGS